MISRLVALLFLGSHGTFAQAVPSPQEVIAKGAKDVREVFRKKGKDRVQKTALKQIVDGFLDYRELARRSLGPHWSERTPEEQREFPALLRELIESSYTGNIRDNPDFKLEFESEEIAEDGATADVYAIASAKNKKGRTVSEDLCFHLFYKNRAWMIFDVEFGDVSMVRHYRGEFNRKIKKESYQALNKAMKKKLKEIQSKNRT
jgi:phospholipid transport system substrate-binding protein